MFGSIPVFPYKYYYDELCPTMRMSFLANAFSSNQSQFNIYALSLIAQCIVLV